MIREYLERRLRYWRLLRLLGVSLWWVAYGVPFLEALLEYDEDAPDA